MSLFMLENGVHFALDRVKTDDVNTHVVASSGASKLVLQGKPRVVVDHEFGSVLEFTRYDPGLNPENDRFEIVDFDAGSTFTFASWIRPETAPEKDGQVLLSLYEASPAFKVTLAQGGTDIAVHLGETVLTFAAGIQAGRWAHVGLAVQDGRTITVCIDGHILPSQTFPEQLQEFKNWIDIGVLVNGTPPEPYAGRLAHVRLCKDLPFDDLGLIHLLDAAPTEDYRQYAPLDFTCLDDQQLPHLYVEGGEIAHRLRVSVRNRDSNGEAVVLHGLPPAAQVELDHLRHHAPYAKLLSLDPKERDTNLVHLTPDAAATARALFNVVGTDTPKDFHGRLERFFRAHHHFMLQFSANALSSKTVSWARDQVLRALSNPVLPDSNTWYICIEHDAATYTYRIYLLAAFDVPLLQPHDVESAAPDLTISLPHIAASADVEAQVLPIEVRPGPLVRRERDFARLGPSVKLIEVQSQIGNRYAPLDFGVVGANQVINDGETQTYLLLRLTNIDSREWLKIDRTGNLQTVFTVSCELTEPGTTEERALTDEQAKVRMWLKGSVLSGGSLPDPDDPKDWTDDPLIGHGKGAMLTWEFDGQSLGEDHLMPGASIILRLTVQTDQRSGPSMLVLKYRHLSGYWDGERTLVINKSPMVLDYNLAAKDNRVGIGTARPASKLAVTDGVSIGETFADATKHAPASKGGLSVEGNVGIGVRDPKTKLHVDGGRLRVSEAAQDGVIEVAGGAKTNYLFTSASTGKLHMRTDSKTHDVILQSTGGKVGIGKMDPDHPLDVNGRIHGVLDGDDLIDGSVTLKELAQAVQDALCPTGTILAYAAKEAPPGWRLCDHYGLWIESPKYRALFEVIGYQFGGYTNNGKKYYKLPDLRGRFLRGWDAGSKRDPDAAARTSQYTPTARVHPGNHGASGNEIGSLQADAIKTHSSDYLKRSIRSGGDYESGAFGRLMHPTSNARHSSTYFGAKETRPKNMYVNFIIKL